MVPERVPNPVPSIVNKSFQIKGEMIYVDA